MSKHVWSPEEVALRWGCNRKTVYREIHRGNLRAFRTGMRRLGVSHADLVRYEEDRALPRADAPPARPASSPSRRTSARGSVDALKAIEKELA